MKNLIFALIPLMGLMVSCDPTNMSTPPPGLVSFAEAQSGVQDYQQNIVSDLCDTLEEIQAPVFGEISVEVLAQYLNYFQTHAAALNNSNISDIHSVRIYLGRANPNAAGQRYKIFLVPVVDYNGTKHNLVGYDPNATPPSAQLSDDWFTTPIVESLSTGASLPSGGDIILNEVWMRPPP